MDTAGCDAICLVPGVRGTSGGRDGEEKKLAPWAPRLMLMSWSLGRRPATLKADSAEGASAKCELPHTAISN